MEKYSLFLFLALISEIIGTVSGFGSSLLFVPIASLFFDFKSVLGITAIFHVFSNLSKIYLFKKGINKDVAIKLGIPAILFVVIGAFITTKTELTKMELVMNIVLVCTALYLLLRFNKKIKQTNTNLVIGGCFSGFLAGLAGTGGAIRGITLAAFNLPKDVFIATSAVIDLGVDTSRAIVYVSNGYFLTEYLILIPFLIVISFLGSYLGKVVLKYTSETLFRYITLGLIILTSIIQIFSYMYQKNTG